MSFPCLVLHHDAAGAAQPCHLRGCEQRAIPQAALHYARVSAQPQAALSSAGNHMCLACSIESTTRLIDAGSPAAVMSSSDQVMCSMSLGRTSHMVLDLCRRLTRLGHSCHVSTELLACMMVAGSMHLYIIRSVEPSAYNDADHPSACWSLQSPLTRPTAVASGAMTSGR
jgi:hypothetical protein